jgi:glutamate carboxypeptidase
MRARPDPRALLDDLAGRRDELVELLRRMTEAESPSLAPETHDRAAEVLGAELETLGFTVRRLRARGGSGQLWARPSGRVRRRPLQLLLGHLDTVWPVGTLAEMPFQVDGDVVRGPGVFDMKGGLAMMLLALGALRRQGVEPPLLPVVFVNSDEEIGSPGSREHIRRIARRVRRAWVLEPALGPSGRLKTARKGVGRFTVHVFGRAAHAGLDPEAGASAILELSHVIRSLFALNDPARGVTVNVGTVDGGLRPNVVAPEGRAVADVRVCSEDDAQMVEAAIRALQAVTPGTRLEIHGGFGRPPMERTPRNRRLWQLAWRLSAELGLELEEGLAGGGSDGSTTSLYTATLDGLGPVGAGAHAPDECLFIGPTLERTALLALLLAAPDQPDAASADERPLAMEA